MARREDIENLSPFVEKNRLTISRFDGSEIETRACTKRERGAQHGRNSEAGSPLRISSAKLSLHRNAGLLRGPVCNGIRGG